MSSALFAAAENGDTKAIRRQLRTGAGNISELLGATNYRGQTPLHVAARLGHEAACAALLQHAATEVNAKDSIGATPLHSAAVYAHLPVVRLLLAQGANPRSADANGLTALEWATREFVPDALLAALHEAPGGRAAAAVPQPESDDGDDDDAAFMSADEFSPGTPREEDASAVAVAAAAGAAGGCPNRSNPFHECTQYCTRQYRVAAPAGQPVAGRRTLSLNSHGAFGFTISATTGEVTCVTEGSPAEKAGMDIAFTIVEIEGEELREGYHLVMRQIAAAKEAAAVAGRSTVTFTVDTGQLRATPVEVTEAGAAAAEARAARAAALDPAAEQQRVKVSQLTSMGFGEAASLSALESAHGDVATATELLLSSVLE